MEEILNADSFKVQFSFDPRQIDENKEEWVYHVIRYTKREGHRYATYYRQKYMDGTLALVNEKKLGPDEFQKLKEFVKEKKDSAAFGTWCIRVYEMKIIA